MATLDPVTNFGKVVVSTGYDAAATSIVLSSGEGAELPASPPAYNLTWYNSTDYPDPADDPTREIVRVTARTADTLTVTRGQEGTTASSHNVVGKIYRMILAFTKKFRDDVETKVDGLERVRFRVHRDGADQTAIVTVTPTKLLFTNDDDIYGLSNTEFSFVNSEFKSAASKPVLMWFHGSARINGLTFEKNFKLILKLDGVDYATITRKLYAPSGTSDFECDIGALILVPALSTVQFWVEHDNGSNRDVDGLQTVTYFEGMAVGMYNRI